MPVWTLALKQFSTRVLKSPSPPQRAEKQETKQKANITLKDMTAKEAIEIVEEKQSGKKGERREKKAHVGIREGLTNQCPWCGKLTNNITTRMGPVCVWLS